MSTFTIDTSTSRATPSPVPGKRTTVPAILARNLPLTTPVFVANSMPVRDVEYFWPVTSSAHQIHFSRGANGIDGTLSTALGIAHGGPPAVLLTGDLALLHDTNGFLSLSKFKGSLTIVLINNDGGGIFGHLPESRCFDGSWSLCSPCRKSSRS